MYFVRIANDFRTYRVLGLMFLASALAVFPLIKELHKDPALTINKKSTGSSKKESQRILDMFDFKLLKNANFVMWCLIGLLHLYSMYIVLAFIPCKKRYVLKLF